VGLPEFAASFVGELVADLASPFTDFCVFRVGLPPGLESENAIVAPFFTLRTGLPSGLESETGAEAFFSKVFFLVGLEPDADFGLDLFESAEE